MSRYINADAIEYHEVFEGDEFVRVAYGDDIDEIPTADVIPIEWIKEQKDKCFPYSTTALVLNGLITEWGRRNDG